MTEKTITETGAVYARSTELRILRCSGRPDRLQQAWTHVSGRGYDVIWKDVKVITDESLIAVPQ